MPLSPSSIIWYQPMGALLTLVLPCLEHWTCDPQVSGFIPSRDFGCNPGKVVHRNVPPLPKSINWYQHKLERHQITPAMHHRHMVYPLTGSTAYDRQMSTSPMFLLFRCLRARCNSLTNWLTIWLSVDTLQ